LGHAWRAAPCSPLRGLQGELALTRSHRLVRGCRLALAGELMLGFASSSRAPRQAIHRFSWLVCTRDWGCCAQGCVQTNQHRLSLQLPVQACSALPDVLRLPAYPSPGSSVSGFSALRTCHSFHLRKINYCSALPA